MATATVTRSAALAALARCPSGWAAILVPDFGRGHYEVVTVAALAALPLYELIAVR
jgi:hypothetical protein